MRRSPESKTPLWRSSRCGGWGCWVNASRVRFMGLSPFPWAVRERSSPRGTTTVRSGAIRPLWDGRFSATLGGAEGGTHRLGANSIDYAEAKQREDRAPKCAWKVNSANFAITGFSEVVRHKTAPNVFVGSSDQGMRHGQKDRQMMGEGTQTV